MARILLATLLLALGACNDSAVPTSATPSTSVPDTANSSAPNPATTLAPATRPPPTISDPVIPNQLASHVLQSVLLDGTELRVAVADTSSLRRQGLMGIQDLGDLDGMVFVFERDTTGGFWMKDTLISLDIAFFDVEGRFVDGFTMEPCTTEDCPSYRPSGSYRYALEMAAGTMPAVVGELRFER